MEIIFKKTGQDEHVLSCRRNDGTITWSYVSSFFIIHDLCHYAVETILPLKKAFFGMIQGGTEITEFDLPKEHRNILLTEEAFFAEQLVNLLNIEYSQGRMENFIEIFNAIYTNKDGFDLVSLITEKKLGEIRNASNEVMQRWQSLHENETMTLLFKE